MKINKNMLIMEIVQDHPEVIETLLENGVHCISCHFSEYETLEQGLRVHGYDDKKINQVVKELNEAIEYYTENAPIK